MAGSACWACGKPRSQGAHEGCGEIIKRKIERKNQERAFKRLTKGDAGRYAALVMYGRR